MHPHTETHGEIPQHSTTLQHEFQQLLSYLTVHNITAEKTGKKEKAPHLKSAVYTNTGPWIHPLAWKNKSLQYNHFSINVWKYFTAWCNKSVMRLRDAVRALQGTACQSQLPPGSPLRSALGTFSWKVWKSDFLKWISNSLWRGKGSINLC